MRKLGRMALASVALAVVAAMAIEIRASAKWAEFTARTNLLRAKLEAERGEREPLVGPVRAGNAWDEYAPAMAELRVRMRDASWDVGCEVDRPGSMSSAYATLRQSGGALDRARDAARCERAFSDVPQGLLGPQAAVLLFVLASRQRACAGDLEAALDELAFALQVASDAARAPGVVSLTNGTCLMNAVAHELAALVTDGRVSFAILERIDRLLNALDRQFPTFADAVQWDGVLLRQTLRDVAEGARELDVDSDGPVDARWLAEDRRLAPWKVTLVAWRHGFSRRLLVAEIADWHDRLADAARRDEAVSATDVLLEPALCRGTVAEYRMYERVWRESRGRLRLVRAASRVRRGLDPDTIDPVTRKPAGVRIEPECIMLWLPWGKGDGRGTWKHTRHDLVIVVR